MSQQQNILYPTVDEVLVNAENFVPVSVGGNMSAAPLSTWPSSSLQGEVTDTCVNQNLFHIVHNIVQGAGQYEMVASNSTCTANENPPYQVLPMSAGQVTTASTYHIIHPDTSKSNIDLSAGDYPVLPGAQSNTTSGTGAYQDMSSNAGILTLVGCGSVAPDNVSCDPAVAVLSGSLTDERTDAGEPTDPTLEVPLEHPDHDISEKSWSSKPLKVFQQVTGILSNELLSIIPGSQSVVFEKIQTDLGVELSLLGERSVAVSGDLSALTKVEQKLGSMCGVSESQGERPGEIDPSGDSCRKCAAVTTKDKAVHCDLLLPTVSQRGRTIRPKFNQDFDPWGEGEDVDDRPYTYTRRKRRNNVRNVGGDSRQTQPKIHVNVGVVKKENTESLSSEATPLTDESLETEKDTDPDSKLEASLGDAESANKAEVKPDSVPLVPEKRVKTKKDYELLAPFKFFCKKCSFRTKRQSHFLNHKRLHDKQIELHRCKKCNFTSLRLSHLRRHESTTHSALKFSCTQCHYHTDQPKLLDRHKKNKHTVIKNEIKPLLSCPSCDYTTTRAFHYDRHLQRHPELQADFDGNVPNAHTFQCDMCSYSSQRKEGLYRHKANRHSDKRPFLCDLCGKSFKRPDALVQHKITHVDKEMRNYQFKCHLCSKLFRSQAHLTEHTDSHATDCRHLCDICGKGFKTRSVQRKHMQTIHLNPGAYPCQHCQKRFNTKFALNRHIRTHVAELAADTISNLVEPSDIVTAEVTTAADQIQLQQVHDVIVPSVGEVFEHAGETIQQALIQTDKGPTLLYLTGFPPFHASN